MQITFLNIFRGSSDLIRYKKIVDYIKNENPNILGLAELNGWEKDNFARLNDFLRKTGYPYYSFCKSKSNYHLCIFSKYEITYEKILHKNFRIGAIVIKIKTPKSKISIALTHLHYKNEELRLKELRLLLDALKGKKNVILMGDLNAISPINITNRNGLLKQLKSARITKFGTRVIHTDVITTLLENNFIDTLGQFPEGQHYSVPTLINSDPDHQINLRLDYIFVSKDLTTRVINAKIVNNLITNQISDHFPITTELNI